MDASKAREIADKKNEEELPVRREAVSEAIANEAKGGRTSHDFMPHECPAIIQAELSEAGYTVLDAGRFVTVSW